VPAPGAMLCCGSPFDFCENFEDLAEITRGSVAGTGAGLTRVCCFGPICSFFIEEKDAWLRLVFLVLCPFTSSALDIPVCSVPVALVIRLRSYCFAS